MLEKGTVPINPKDARIMPGWVKWRQAPFYVHRQKGVEVSILRLIMELIENDAFLSFPFFRLDVPAEIS